MIGNLRDLNNLKKAFKIISRLFHSFGQREMNGASSGHHIRTPHQKLTFFSPHISTTPQSSRCKQRTERACAHFYPCTVPAVVESSGCPMAHHVPTGCQTFLCLPGAVVARLQENGNGKGQVDDYQWIRQIYKIIPESRETHSGYSKYLRWD